MSETTNDVTRENPRKVREGIVVPDKMESTVVVAVNGPAAGAEPQYAKGAIRRNKTQ